MPDKTRISGNLVSDNNLFVNTTADNTGIGTTSPTSKLTVIGDVNVSGVVTATTFIGNLTGTATTTTNVIGGIGSLSSLRVSGIITASSFVGDSASVRDLNVSGITTSTTLNIGVGGTIISITSGGNIGFRTTNPIQPFQVGTGSSIVVIDNVGKLGIGTTNPQVTLDVFGDVRISGVITATNFIGSGKDLTDVVSRSSIRKDNILVGSAVSTINFTGSGISTVTVSSGIATVTIQGLQTSVTTYTTSLLASNGSENFTLTTPSIFQLLVFTASTPSWIRVYGTSSSRTADTRTSPGGTLPLPGTEYYAELVTTTTPQTIRLSPVPTVQSTSNQIFLNVKNMDNTSRVIVMEFTTLSLKE